MTQVGGVALWLERRSLTGELSMIYASPRVRESANWLTIELP